MRKKDVTSIFEIFHDGNPSPKTELIFTNAYECLIAVLLSAQTTDIQVNKVTRGLFSLANNPKAMLELTEAQIIETIKHIGLFRNKAKNIIATSKILVEQFGAQVPADLEALQTLPGVGRKTALVVLNAVFGQATLAVDTHVQRVSHRIGLVKNCKTPLQTELKLMEVIPQKYLKDAHHWLILHGRYVCKARTPACSDCKLSLFCLHYKVANKNKANGS